MRLSIVTVVSCLLLAVASSVVFAQDSLPPNNVVPVHPVARPDTPDTLIGKSIKDLSRGRLDAAVKDDIKALRRGPLLMHGNYCGIGNRPHKPPVDDLDAACMRHDACTQTGKLPSCACDDRLRIEAGDIAKDQSTPPDIKAVASATAAAMSVLICKTSPGASAVTVPALGK